MIGRKAVSDEVAKLDFTVNPAGFDAFHDFFEVANSGGEMFHLAETLINLGELARDGFETFVETLSDGLLELFVHSETHLFQFFGVVVLETFDTLIHSAADGLEVLADFLAVFAELGFNLGREFVELAFNPN